MDFFFTLFAWSASKLHWFCYALRVGFCVFCYYVAHQLPLLGVISYCIWFGQVNSVSI